MAKLTQKALEALRAEHSGITVRDEGNLFGRVRAGTQGTVTVSFYYRYRYDGKSKDFSCGTWPGNSLSSIRTARDAARTRVAQGIDPAVQKKLARQEGREAISAKLAEIAQQEVDGLTVQNLFDTWLADGVRRKDGNAELRRTFHADVLPKLGKKPVRDVSEHDLRLVLRALVGRGVNRSAVVMRNNLTQMFAWAEKRAPWRKLLAEGNPMELIEIEKIVSPDYDLDYRRDRVLSEHEIRELRDAFKKIGTEYEAAPNKRIATQPVEATVQRAIWIMLSTLCRVGELSRARWENVDLDARKWFIPAEDTKGNRRHQKALTVYLSFFAVEQFRELKKVTGDTDWCFPARNKDGHLYEKAISKQVGDRQAMFKKTRDGSARQPMKHRRHDNSLVLGGGVNGAWTPHDLRRTGATLMQSLGVGLDIIDRCQNHVLAGSKVRRHYLHHDYADEKRVAWSLLGERLTTILAAPNVIPFPRTA